MKKIAITILIMSFGISSSIAQQNIPILNYHNYLDNDKLEIQYLLPDTMLISKGWGEFNFSYYPEFKQRKSISVYPNQNTINSQIAIDGVKKGFFSLQENGMDVAKTFFNVFEGDDFVSDTYDAKLLLLNNGSAGLNYDNGNTTGKVILSANGYRLKPSFKFGGIKCISEVVNLELSSQATFNGENHMIIRYHLPSYNDVINYDDVVIMKWDKINTIWTMYNETPLVDSNSSYALFSIDEPGSYAVFKILDFHSISQAQDTASYMETKQISSDELEHSSLVDTAAVQVCEAKGSITLMQSFHAVKTSDFTARIVPNFGTMNARTIAYSPTEIQELSEEKINEEILNISIYPNPVQEKLFISQSKDNEQKINYVKIVNLSGSTILTESLTSGDNFINLSRLNTGIYIIIMYNNNSIVKKDKIFKY